MKHPLHGLVFDIQRASLHDGPGIRTTVFFKGCLLNCRWCHNPEAVRSDPELFFYPEKCTLCETCSQVCPEDVHHFVNGVHLIDYQKCTACGKCVEACNFYALKIIGVEMSVDQILQEVLADFDYYQKSGGGMTLSGGEPFAQFDFMLELLKRSRAEAVNTCVETSGQVNHRNFEMALPFIDTLLFDYKITNADDHKKYTGVTPSLSRSNLDMAYRAGTPIILRCPIIPGVNDTEEHFKEISRLNVKYPDLRGIEILPYHDVGNHKRLSIGQALTFSALKTTSPEMSGEWLDRLKRLGCEKAVVM